MTVDEDPSSGKPLCIDLFCGLGGLTKGFLAEGYRTIGFDNDTRFASVYPGEFVLQDVRTLDGHRFSGARCIVGGPPCQKLTMLNVLRPPADDVLGEAVSLFWEVKRIADEAGVPWVAENVQGAQRYVGKAVAHRGHRYFWGDVPPLPFYKPPMKVGAVMRARAPDGSLRPARLRQWGARDRSAKGAALRAHVELPLARAIARGFL